MKILVLNASPKRRGSASSLYSSILRLPLLGCEVHTCPLCGVGDFAKALPLYGQLPHRLLKRSKADHNNEKECPL